jgi:cobalamin biosynthesis Mg chelatase CobN
VTLKIERLVIEGFAERDQARVVEAFGAELTRLFKESGSPEQGARLGRLDGGVIQAQPGGAPEWHGAQAAQRLHSALMRPNAKGARR